MNMTTKQIISLILMTLALIVALALSPEHQEESGQARTAADLTGQVQD